MATEEQIKQLAYAIWEQEGRPHGKDTEHYFRAKQIIEQQEREATELAAATSRMETPPQTATPPAEKKRRRRK